MIDEEEILLDPLANLDDEETVTPTPEKEKDNSSTDDKEAKEEEKEEKPVKVEPKKDLAKEKRHQEQEAGSLTEVKRLRGIVVDRAVKDAASDISSLIDLQRTDTKLAKEVAAKFDWSETSRGDYDSFLAAKGVVAEKPTHISEEEIEKRVEARLAQREHDSALVKAQELLNELPEELQAEAVEEFNDLIEGRTLTIEKALKLANLVTLSLKKGKPKVDTTEALKKLSSTGLNQTKKPSKEDKMLIITPNGDELLLDSNELN